MRWTQALPGRTFRRWVVFSFVGGTGIVIQVAVLGWLLDLGLHYLAATAMAVEAAVLNNFLWHEQWTWRDRTRGYPSGTLPRLARFNLTVGAISIAQNLVLMKVLIAYFAMPLLAGNLIAIAVSGLANFLVSDWLVFRVPQKPASITEEIMRCPFGMCL